MNEKGYEIPCKHYRDEYCYLGEFVTECPFSVMKEIGRKGLESFVTNCERKKKASQKDI